MVRLSQIDLMKPQGTLFVKPLYLRSIPLFGYFSYPDFCAMANDAVNQVLPLVLFQEVPRLLPAVFCSWDLKRRLYQVLEHFDANEGIRS